MFQFTTERLLNDLSSVSVVTQADDKAIPTGGKGLKIKGTNTYIASHVSTVWKALGTPAVKEVGLLTIPAITVAGTYRFEVNTQLSGSADPDYARYDRSFGKPIFVEMNLAANATLADIVANLNKVFNQYTSPVSMKGTVFAVDTGKLSITANSEYVRFVGANFAKYDLTLDEYVKFDTGFTIKTHGDQGFATAWDLLKNFRMPTQAATYFTAENLDERPVAGTIYNQYTFRYEVNRNIHGTGVVGEVAKSVTTHVFYVLSNLSTAFEALLTQAGLTVVVASTDPATPVDDEQGSDVPPTPAP